MLGRPRPSWMEKIMPIPTRRATQPSKKIRVFVRKEVTYAEPLNEYYDPDEALQMAVERAAHAPLDRDASHAVEMASLEPLGRDAPWRVQNLHNLQRSCDHCGWTYLGEAPQPLCWIRVLAQSAPDTNAMASSATSASTFLAWACLCGTMVRHGCESGRCISYIDAARPSTCIYCALYSSSIIVFTCFVVYWRSRCCVWVFLLYCFPTRFYLCFVLRG